MTILTSLFSSIWGIFQDASLYLLLGYGLATVLHLYLDPQKLVNMLGQNRFGAIIKATLYGIPLPLCSCAVVPSTITLKKKGVSDGATIAYLIATPESGLDSIAVTYGLMGGAFALFRVMSAFFIAITTGSVIELVEAWSTTATEQSDNSNDTQNCYDSCRTYKGENEIKTLAGWIKSFIGNFHELFDETAALLMVGLLISGLIDFLIPVGFFQQQIFSGFLSYILMLLIGLPMYICASASTPIAAMLIYKGLSPGAALVFLLAGPATNLGSLVLLIRIFGKRTIYAYLAVLSVLTLLAGFAVDSLQSLFPVNLSDTLTQAGIGERTILEPLCAVLFLVLVASSFSRTDSYRKMGKYFEDFTGIKLTGKRVTTAFCLLFFLGYLSSGVLIVQADQLAIIERFGKPHAQEYPPGIYLHYPYPIEIARIMNPYKTRTINLGFKISKTNSKDKKGLDVFRVKKVENESNYLTGDENIIDIESSIQYKINNVKEFLYNSIKPADVLRQLIRAAVTQELGTYPIDQIYTTERQNIEQSVAEKLQADINQLNLGITILKFNLLYVHAPVALHYAFRDIASAMEDKETTIYNALEYAIQANNLAQADAYKTITKARAHQLEVVAKAGGEAKSFRLQQAEYSKNPDALRLRLYLEKIEQVLQGNPKFISPENGAGIDLWLAPPRTTPPPLIKEKK
jgi:HflK protein